MKLIIDIPEKVVTAIQNGEDYRYDIHTAIASGTPHSPQGDLISREDLKKAVFNGTFDTRSKILSLIDNAPTVAVTDYDTGYQDGLEAGLNDIRTKGEWIDSGVTAEGISVFMCSVCHRQIVSNCLPKYRSIQYPFCNCGADMQKGGAE